LTIEVGILFAAVSGAIGIATFIIGRQSAAKSAGQNEGRLLTELEFLKKTVERIEHILERLQTAYQDDLKEQRQYFEAELRKHREETTDSIKRLHDRIDGLRA
jgi:hypothetical protein